MSIRILSRLNLLNFYAFNIIAALTSRRTSRCLKIRKQIVLVMITLFSLSACDDGGSSDAGIEPQVKISGLLNIPGGSQAVSNKSIQLLRVNNDGDIVGNVLDSTTSDQSGNYVLVLPDGVELSSDLIVSADIGDNKSARAIVIDETTDITPITEYITAKLIADPDLDLSNLPASEVSDLVTFVESLNLSTQANLEDTLVEIETASEVEIETRIVLLTNPGIKLSGLLAAPGPAAKNQSMLLRPVPNTTIHLYRIDNDGNVIGGSLASTTTDAAGEYELELPEGMLLASDLVLRAEVDTDVFLNALAVSQELNIDATSEYVFTQVVESPALEISSLSIGSILGLVEYAESLNLSDAADLNATLLAIDSAAGTAIESQIADIQILSASSNLGVFGSTNWGNSVFQ
jgi:hypothetical protein